MRSSRLGKVVDWLRVEVGVTYKWLELAGGAAWAPFARVVDDALFGTRVNVIHRVHKDVLLVEVSINDLQTSVWLVVL